MSPNDAAWGRIKERERLLVLLSQHIPSLSETNEAEITERAFKLVRSGLAFDGTDVDVAELAIRTCMCGRRIEDFYDYTDHLGEVFRAAA